MEVAIFGSCVLVDDKSQLVIWWLALAREMYQPDNIGRTCPLCYSYHKLLRVSRKSLVVLCSLCQTISTRGLPARDSSSITGLALDKSFVRDCIITE